jgi:hypothetical protein
MLEYMQALFAGACTFLVMLGTISILFRWHALHHNLTYTCFEIAFVLWFLSVGYVGLWAFIESTPYDPYIIEKHRWGLYVVAGLLSVLYLSLLHVKEEHPVKRWLAGVDIC